MVGLQEFVVVCDEHNIQILARIVWILHQYAEEVNGYRGSAPGVEHGVNRHYHQGTSKNCDRVRAFYLLPHQYGSFSMCRSGHHKETSMKLGFMTFLYPELDHEAVIAKGEKFGYSGIEWRVECEHQHGVELDAPTGKIHAIRDRVAGAGMETSCLATGVKFCSPEVNEREANLERLTRYIGLASEIGAPFIRILADPIPNTGRGAREASYRYQADYLARAAEKSEKADVRLCLETHSVFRAFDVGEVLFRAAYPSALRINWHLAHCINHGEDVDEAYRHVKGLVIHAHFAMSSEVERQMELLAAEGYHGYYSVEIMAKSEAEGDTIMSEQVAGWTAARDALGLS
jgi:sugar phosphate isomerase/epimerase